jgi:hypothetical protein
MFYLTVVPGFLKGEKQYTLAVHDLRFKII